MSCDVGEEMESLENELCYDYNHCMSCDIGRVLFSNPSFPSPTSQLILQPFLPFTYVAAHSPTLPFLHLRRSSFSNPSVTSPTSQLIIQPFLKHFTYVSWRASHDIFTLNFLFLGCDGCRIQHHPLGDVGGTLPRARQGFVWGNNYLFVLYVQLRRHQSLPWR